jgi:hypothetical protein
MQSEVDAGREPTTDLIVGFLPHQDAFNSSKNIGSTAAHTVGLRSLWMGGTDTAQRIIL